ncbi:MAG: hypothetical protein KDB21_03000 [Acidimicrobiales bacterium]|nr:hypothetical protein [Acidimicrobiales bacterium]
MTSLLSHGGRRRAGAAALVLALGLGACSSDVQIATDDTATPTPVVSASPSPEATAGEAGTATPVPTTSTGPTVTAAPTAEPSAAPAATPTPLPTAVPPTPVPSGPTVVVEPYGDLLGVGLGTFAPDAAFDLVAALGAPEEDSGWVVGCPLDDPDAANERIMRWGSLTARFYDYPDEGMRFDAWEYLLDPATGDAYPGGPGIDQIDLPGSITMGDPMSSVAAELGVALYFDDVFGWVSVAADGLVLIGLDGADNSPLNLVGVPYVPTCE